VRNRAVKPTTPLATRICRAGNVIECRDRKAGRIEGRTYHYSVFRRKDGKLIQAGDEVPAGGDVASYKDAERQDGKRMHRLLRLLATHAVDGWV